MASKTPPSLPTVAPASCLLCANPRIMELADRLVCGGLDDVGVAKECGVTRDQLRNHLEVCAVRGTGRAALDQESHAQGLLNLAQDAPGDALDGQAIISRLNNYLRQVEAIIAAGEPSDIRGMLLALDQARKVCETMAKLYLDIMQAQLDLNVQNEFRRIVIEAVNAADPATRERIVAEIQTRAAVFGVLGGGGGQ